MRIPNVGVEHLQGAGTQSGSFWFVKMVLAAMLIGSLGAASNFHGDDSGKAGKSRAKNSRDDSKRKQPDRAGTAAASSENRTRAIQAIREGRYDAARSLIRAAIKASDSTSVKHSWRIVESELEFSTRQLAKSALIAMRIVILTPDSEQLGAAYFRAGRAYEKMGRVDKAIELFEACAAHRMTGDLTKKKAIKRLEVLNAASEKK